MDGDCFACQRGPIPILCGKREQLNVVRFKFVFFYDACEPFLCFRPQMAGKRGVCKDWMVVCAVICEPVSL